MSNVLDKTRIEDFQPDALDMALDEVLGVIALRLKPKARVRVLDELSAQADRLDNFTRAGRVVSIRAPRPLSALEQQDKARAAAIRYLLGRAF